MSAQTDLLRQVVAEVGLIGDDPDEVSGAEAIDSHIQSIVDDPNGEVIMGVVNGVAGKMLYTAATTGADPGLVVVAAWTDGFSVGAEYMRQRIEKGL